VLLVRVRLATIILSDRPCRKPICLARFDSEDLGPPYAVDRDHETSRVALSDFHQRAGLSAEKSPRYSPNLITREISLVQASALGILRPKRSPKITKNHVITLNRLARLTSSTR
jgi:hypothetical protein